MPEAAEQPLVRPATAQKPGFFERNNALPPEIIEGILREKQIAVLGGAFGMGKSPLLVDLTICTLYGLPWCGRRIAKRPVIAIDFENPPAMFKENLTNIAKRRGVPRPEVPDDLDIYLYTDDVTERATKRLIECMGKEPYKRLNLLIEALERKPNALVLIDPIDLLFPASDKLKSEDILWQYNALRHMLSYFPKAAVILTRNLRKRDRRGGAPNLLHDPRGWLEDIAGSLDILNRCDVRIGVDLFNPKAEITDTEIAEGVRILNGVRRGESFEALYIRPAHIKDETGKLVVNSEGKVTLAGFEAAEALGLVAVLTPKQFNYWENLPGEFRFEDGAKEVPRVTLSRILQKAQGVDAVRLEGGVWRKRKEAEIGVTWESMGISEPGEASVNE